MCSSICLVVNLNNLCICEKEKDRFLYLPDAAALLLTVNHSV